jgi:hypothetical protein
MLPSALVDMQDLPKHLTVSCMELFPAEETKGASLTTIKEYWDNGRGENICL